jgi:membrane protein
MMKTVSGLLGFLRTGIWVLPTKDLSRPKALFVRALKILLLAIRGFRENQCGVKASALTFYSLLSVVPIVAMGFGIAKGFGFDRRLQGQLLERFSGYEDVLLKVFEFSNSLLQKTRGGIIAGIGVALLFWSVIKVMGEIEHSFNHIWKVEKSRTIARKASDYLSAMLVCPVIFLMASSLTVAMTSQVENVAAVVSRYGVPSAPILLILDTIPLILIWVLFAFLLIYMPNTKVRLRPGLISSVAAGTAYQATQWVYVSFQVGVARANAIYGSFAALPLFLIWLQLSWLIVLLGAELCFAIQNEDPCGFPADPGKVRPFDRKLLALLVARLVIRNFSEGKKPLNAPGIAHALGMPIGLIRRILSDLSVSGLFSGTEREEYEEPAYLPSRDIHQITVNSVLDALDRSGSADLAFPPTEDFEAISEILDSIGRAIEQSPANRLLIDL